MIKNVNVILLLLLCLGLRSLYDANISQAIIFVSVAAVYGYMRFIEAKAQQEGSLSEAVSKQLEEMKSVVGSLAIKNSTKPQVTKEEINKRWF